LVKRVLIIDDSPTIREQVRAALDSGGYQTVEAIDGADGLRKLAADEGIGLVICDVNMPGVGGLEMLDRLSHGGRLAQLPFVMLTTECSSSAIERARKAGARGWLVKPFKPALLLAAVRKLLPA
jgi:two-component system, chemotaxis family, chemotaxis protein CheY